MSGCLEWYSKIMSCTSQLWSPLGKYLEGRICPPFFSLIPYCYKDRAIKYSDISALCIKSVQGLWDQNLPVVDSFIPFGSSPSSHPKPSCHYWWSPKSTQESFFNYMKHFYVTYSKRWVPSHQLCSQFNWRFGVQDEHTPVSDSTVSSPVSLKSIRWQCYC